MARILEIAAHNSTPTKIELSELQAKVADRLLDDADLEPAIYQMTDIAVLLGYSVGEVLERVTNHYRVSVNDMTRGYVPSHLCINEDEEAEASKTSDLITY
jgi:hypothetical protein